MDPDGADDVDLTPGCAGYLTSPAWSADGNSIVVVAGCSSSTDIMTMSATGANFVAVTNTPDVTESAPAFSPDGARIVYTRTITTSDADVWVTDVDGSNQTALTTNDYIDDDGASWSPDGTSIVFSSDRGGTRDLYVMDPDGTHVVQITHGANAINPSWSPDGARIAYSVAGQLWWALADGSNPRRLSTTVGGYPGWSPDEATARRGRRLGDQCRRFG